MLSRLGGRAAVSAWRVGSSKDVQVGIVFRSQSAVAAQAPASSSPVNVRRTQVAKLVETEGVEQFDQEYCYNPYPEAMPVQSVAVDSMAEIKKEDKPVEDEYCVWFGRDMPTILDEQKPERDHANFPRFIRPVNPPQTRLLIFPEEWFKFFYEKTGVTGPYLFGLGTSVFLFSKEFYVVEHNFWHGVCLAVWISIAVKLFGEKVSNRAEKMVAQEINGWLNYQEGSIKSLEDYIAQTKKNMAAVNNQKILFDAKRENVHLQREAEYRRRLMVAFEETKRKLNCQVAINEAQKQFAQRHMVNWIVDSVHKGITADQEKLALNQALADLKSLATQRAGTI